MTKWTVSLAALGLGLLGPGTLGATAAHAQSMTLTSSDIKEGATIANEQVFMLRRVNKEAVGNILLQ